MEPAEDAPRRRPLHTVMTRKRNAAFEQALLSQGLDAALAASVVATLCGVYDFDPDASTRAYTAYRSEQLRRRAAELGVSMRAARAAKRP